jgi:hypothetical protein
MAEIITTVLLVLFTHHLFRLSEEGRMSWRGSSYRKLVETTEV